MVESLDEDEEGILSNLGKRMQAPQARISKPKSEADAITDYDKLN
jgi:hypothetical protein